MYDLERFGNANFIKEREKETFVVKSESKVIVDLIIKTPIILW